MAKDGDTEQALRFLVEQVSGRLKRIEEAKIYNFVPVNVSAEPSPIKLYEVIPRNAVA